MLDSFVAWIAQHPHEGDALKVVASLATISGFSIWKFFEKSKERKRASPSENGLASAVITPSQNAGDHAKQQTAGRDIVELHFHHHETTKDAKETSIKARPKNPAPMHVPLDYMPLTHRDFPFHTNRLPHGMRAKAISYKKNVTCPQCRTQLAKRKALSFVYNAAGRIVIDHGIGGLGLEIVSKP